MKKMLTIAAVLLASAAAATGTLSTVADYETKIEAGQNVVTLQEEFNAARRAFKAAQTDFYDTYGNEGGWIRQQMAAAQVAIDELNEQTDVTLEADIEAAIDRLHYWMNSLDVDRVEIYGGQVVVRTTNGGSAEVSTNIATLDAVQEEFASIQEEASNAAAQSQADEIVNGLFDEIDNEWGGGGRATRMAMTFDPSSGSLQIRIWNLQGYIFASDHEAGSHYADLMNTVYELTGETVFDRTF